MAGTSYTALISRPAMTSTIYTSISPQTEDYFVSTESYQKTAWEEPKILHSLICSIDQTEVVAEFEAKCGSCTGVELNELIQRARTHIIPNLIKKKNITDLSKLLVCRDRIFQKFVLRKLKSVICNLDISLVPFFDVTNCLANVMKIFRGENAESVLEMGYESCLPVMDLLAITMLQFCFRNNEKKTIENGIRSMSKEIETISVELYSKKKFKKIQPKSFAALKCLTMFVKSLSEFQLSRSSQTIFERWEDAFLSRQHTEQLDLVVTQAFYEQYMVMFGFLLKLKKNASVHDHFLKFVHLLFKKNNDKKWSDVQHHALAETALRGMGSWLCYSKGKNDNLMSVIEVCWKGISGQHGFLSLPEELSDHLFSNDKQRIQSVIQTLNISEGYLLECAEKYLQRRVTDIVIHDANRKTLPKKGDHSYWSMCQGRINEWEVTVAIHVPGISRNTLKGADEEDISNKMLENDFKILKGFQKNKTHVNIIRLLAYSDSGSSLPFYVKDMHKYGMLEKLLHERERKTRLPVSWFNNRLVDIVNALSFLHREKIVHRDLTLRAFHLAQYSGTEEDVAVLHDFNLARQTDFSRTAPSKVADLHGDGIPIRWSAVESILQDNYDVRSDIWMFGHVIHEMFTYGCEPFTDQYSSNTDDIISGLLSGDIVSYCWPCIPFVYHKISVSCWKPNPDERPSPDEILQTLRQLRGKCKLEDEEPKDLPRISQSQEERGHEPERGVSNFIRNLKEESLEKKENVRKTLIKMRRKSHKVKSAVLENPPIVCENDIQRDVIIKETEEHLCVQEQVGSKFCERILTIISADFCNKMGILEGSLRREKAHSPDHSVVNIIKYKYPKAVNILRKAGEISSPKSCIDMLLAVVKLVQRMHQKGWLMVALTGANIYIDQQGDQHQAFLVKLGKMVRFPSASNINEEIICVSEKFEDMIFWIPREVICFGQLSTGSDVYTMAMLFYQVYMAYSGHSDLQTVPFARTHKSHILGVLNEGHRPDRPEKCPTWLYDDVMIPCWHADRSCRPSVDDVVRIMTEKINGGSGISASSLLDKQTATISNSNSSARYDESGGDGYLDVVPGNQHKSKERNVINESEDGYDDVQNIKIEEDDSNWSLLPSPGQSLVLGEKDMNLFEMSGDQTTASAASSCISPPAPDTDPGFPAVRLTEPQPFRNKSQAFGTTDALPEPHESKNNPLFQSIHDSIGTISIARSTEKQDILKDNLDSQQMNSSVASAVNASDFLRADSIASQTSSESESPFSARFGAIEEINKEKENILPDFYAWLKDNYENIKVMRLYIGKPDLKQHRFTAKQEVIVLVIDGFNPIKENSYQHHESTLAIICKLWKFLPKNDVSMKADVKPLSNDTMLSKVEKQIQSVSKSLFQRHSNLEIVSASDCRLKDIGEEMKLLPEICIVLYCSCKGVVPLHETEFPKEIEGIKTDVREGFFHLFGNDDIFKRSTDFLDPLLMGASISKKDGDSGGTLGGFVTLNNGGIGFITCAHVFFDLSSQFDLSAQFDVVQPSFGYKNTNKVCGTHTKSCFPGTSNCTIDAALVTIAGRVPERGLFADLTVDNLKENGYSIKNLPEYSTGDIRDCEVAGRRMLPCLKWGAKTGLTKGMLRLEGTAVRWTNELINLHNPPSQFSYVYNNQLEIQGISGTSFALPGDSGALVFQIEPAREKDDHQLHCIGMIVGGTSAGKTIVTPIKPILEALNVKMHTFSLNKMDES